MRKIFTMFSAIIFCTLFTSNIVFGQISLTTMNTAVTENFDTLLNAGTTNTVVPAGWAFAETGTLSNTTYAAGTGSSSTGNTYSFGSAASSDRAFGGLQSNSVNPTVGGSFINNTGSTVTLLSIAYTGEQWRLGRLDLADQLDFQYSTDATSLTTGTWTDVNSLDFISPTTAGTAGQIDGNLAANRTAISSSISNLNFASGATIWIRWNDFDRVGADDGLGVDDFSITPSNPLEIVTTNTMPNGQTTVAYTTPIAAAGGVAPYTYSFVAGAVPTGLTLNPDGTWSGTPTVAGIYNFDVQVTDSNPFTNATDLKLSQVKRLAILAPNTKTESFQITINTPTAAGSLLKGRLVTSTGRGLSNSLVMLTNTRTGEVKSARSSAFGYFTFEDLPSGDFYILDVPSKRYRFNQTSFTLNGDLTDLVLTAQ